MAPPPRNAKRTRLRPVASVIRFGAVSVKRKTAVIDIDLQLPGESRSAEDGSVRFLELREDDLHLVFPQRKDIGVHRLFDRLTQELLGASETAEKHDGFRGTECDEVCE